METGERILEHLDAVARERAQRDRDAALHTQVLGLKAYQQQRFRNTYADLLLDTRYAAAARFFLEELYGPEDFTDRDAQFARIVGPLVRLFPREIVATVERLAALHALSERLDTEMARYSATADGWSRDRYVHAWQWVGEPAARQDQVSLLLDVGTSLDKLTRNPLVRHGLRAMRGPAKTAGLGELQAFLESGFDTFRQMRGAQEFLQCVRSRESALCERLFAADVPAGARPVSPEDPLGQLP